MKLFRISYLRGILGLKKRFSSRDYWNKRYLKGGNSGPGSYGRLAKFKASFLNEFVRSNGVVSVVEFGCGDGHQLALADYPAYTGYDVSPLAVERCKNAFLGDEGKEFFLLEDYDGRRYDLAISLDVIFHLTEDAVFEKYMRTLFDASSRYVIVYSSNQDQDPELKAAHVKHRRFTDWVDGEVSAQWRLVEKIPNDYPYDGDSETSSFSDFYVYKKLG